MDDLAPAPAQRTSDDGRLKAEDAFSPRKKAPKKVPLVPPKGKEAHTEGEPDHQLDVLA